MPYLLGASSPVTTVITPSRASARLASMRLMMACGYGECRILPMSMPESERSSVYFPAPVVLPAESMSATGLPMTENSDIALSSRGGDAFLLGANRCLNRLIHLRVAGTATQIAAERMTNIFIAGLGIAIEQRLDGHDEP